MRMDWMKSVTQHLFVLTESFVWFIAIRVTASALDRDAMGDIARDLESGFAGPVGDAQIVGAVISMRAAMEHVTSGPSLPSVILTAFAAVFISRMITQLRMSRSLAALVGIVTSMVLINILLHITVGGDLRVWDNSTLVNFLSAPGERFAGMQEASEFLADPDPARVHGASLGPILVGLSLLWVRFLYVGRAAVNFEQVLRSFSVGFVGVMFFVVVAEVAGTPSVVWALPYFVLGMLGLAVANAARTGESEQGFGSSAPWMASALVTMGLLAAIAALFGLLAMLEVERALTPIGSILMTVVGWVLVIVLTPVFWLISAIMGLIFQGADTEFLNDLGQNFNVAEGIDREGKEGIKWPGWIFDALKLLFFTIVVSLLWLLGRFLFSRPPDDGDDGPYAEERSEASGVGIGGLFRNLFSGKTKPSAPDWLAMHRIYPVFARTVNGAEDRGFVRRPGETPIEFARAATLPLDAALFSDVANVFDRARYGRHYPDDAEVAALAESLIEWERTHPATAELRQTVRRDMDDDDHGPDEPPDLPTLEPEALTPTAGI
ncbi:MAG TPA: DUF4129 domain-containing protein [Dehalococcoidia bacterium]|nr:DUF4129 domain-containing protein [Dehalococcoidia bacterium]